MANIRVRPKLEKALKDIDAALKQIRLYSGISDTEAQAIDTIGTNIAEAGAHVAALAREKMGSREKNLVGKVRKALGYTYP